MESFLIFQEMLFYITVILGKLIEIVIASFDKYIFRLFVFYKPNLWNQRYI